MDNLETRKVLNRVSLQKGIPFVFGGVDGFDGMASTFVPGPNPCLECLFPFSGRTGRKVGVVGPLPGMIASIQSLETLKLILELEGVLKSRLLYISGSDMSFREIPFEKNPHCRACGNMA
jgi:adenylyltransferase/sulfurtransferase